MVREARNSSTVPRPAILLAGKVVGKFCFKADNLEGDVDGGRMLPCEGVTFVGSTEMSRLLEPKAGAVGFGAAGC